jgi:hypothetical protein
MKTNIHLLSYVADFLDKQCSWNVVEKVKTHILCSITPPPLENHAVYEIIWKKNILEPEMPQMTI